MISLELNAIVKRYSKLDFCIPTLTSLSGTLGTGAPWLGTGAKLQV